MRNGVHQEGHAPPKIRADVEAILRWGLLLPIVTTSAFATMVFGYRALRWGYGAAGISPEDTVARVLSGALLYGMIGVVSVSIGAVTAPQGKRYVAMVLAGILLLYAGNTSYQAIVTGLGWPIVDGIALAAGAAGTFSAIAKREGRRSSEPNVR